MLKKPCLEYHFAYEGETEGLYLEHLSRLINADETALYKVSFDKKKSLSPCDYVKRKTFRQETEIYQVADFESIEEIFQLRFKKLMADMKKAHTITPNAYFTFAYSNLTFELWMVLHKIDCNAPKTNRCDYLRDINRAFGENFKDTDEYKRKKNFERCLVKISLEDVKDAIRRAKAIMTQRKQYHREKSHYGYKYYEENPSLMIWESVEWILSDCGLL